MKRGKEKQRSNRSSLNAKHSTSSSKAKDNGGSSGKQEEERLDTFLKRKQEELKGLSNNTNPERTGVSSKTSTALERLKALDTNFRKEIETMEQHWLYKINTVLREIVDKIQERVGLGMGDKDLIRALDVISDKYNLEQGKPTSRRDHRHFIGDLTEEELDERIKDKQHRLESMKRLGGNGEGKVIDVPNSDVTTNSY